MHQRVVGVVALLPGLQRHVTPDTHRLTPLVVEHVAQVFLAAQRRLRLRDALLHALARATERPRAVRPGTDRVEVLAQLLLHELVGRVDHRLCVGAHQLLRVLRDALRRRWPLAGEIAQQPLGRVVDPAHETLLQLVGVALDAPGGHGGDLSGEGRLSLDAIGSEVGPQALHGDGPLVGQLLRRIDAGNGLAGVWLIGLLRQRVGALHGALAVGF